MLNHIAITKNCPFNPNYDFLAENVIKYMAESGETYGIAANWAAAAWAEMRKFIFIVHDKPSCVFMYVFAKMPEEKSTLLAMQTECDFEIHELHSVIPSHVIHLKCMLGKIRDACDVILAYQTVSTFKKNNPNYANMIQTIEEGKTILECVSANTLRINVLQHEIVVLQIENNRLMSNTGIHERLVDVGIKLKEDNQ